MRVPPPLRRQLPNHVYDMCVHIHKYQHSLLGGKDDWEGVCPFLRSAVVCLDLWLFLMIYPLFSAVHAVRSLN